MPFIFMDESGCLGFDKNKTGSSKYFIVTFLFAKSKRPIEKSIKSARKTLPKKLQEKSGILHAYHSKDITRKRLLTSITEKDCKVMSIILNKEKVYSNLQDEKQVLYNYITNILIDRVLTKKLIPTNNQIEFIAETRETNKFLNEQFVSYLQGSVTNNHKIDMTISLKRPFEEKALQAVDFLSWAIYRKYEYGDETFYDIIKENIVEENMLYK